MNDLTGMLDVGCTVILKLAVACALLALAKLFWSWSKPKPETLVWASGNGPSTVSAGPACQVVITPKEEPQQLEPEVEPEPVLARQTVMCGNCNGEIKSSPIEDGKDATIYCCETCGMRVKAPLTA